MTTNRIVVAASLVFLFLSVNVFAITDQAVFRNFQFSFQNPGARSTAMGGAFIGLADDATAAEANPAGLTILTKPEVSFEYRNTKFDNNFLDSFSLEQGFNRGSIDINSQNDIDDVNQLSFLSVVFPSDRITVGVSRQEVLNISGNINETLSIVLIPGDPPLIVQFNSRAATDQRIVNYNFSASTKVSDTFSLGLTVRYSQLDFQSRVENSGIVGTQEVALFQTDIDDSDSGIAFNVGGLWSVSKNFAVGGVYKKNPKFEVQGVETGDGAAKPGPYTNVFKIPDSYGFGIAIKPNDNMTISADYQRIEYSDLLEGILAGYNIFTDLLTNADITYKIDDANEFHVGTEFVVFLKNVPVALRQGYYFKPSNSLVVDSLAPQFQDSRPFLDAVFVEREDEHHFTFGAGAVFGPHFQLDWAMDIANPSDSFVLSSVVRF